jgi:phosphatidylglycerophosphate synthase
LAQQTLVCRTPPPSQVLLLPPNLVCHLRLLLAVVAAHAARAGGSSLSLALFAASLALDAADGWLARRLCQHTSFGAFYDVLADNVTRGLLWCAAAGERNSLWPWAGALPALEGATFACTHACGGAAWKTGCFRCAALAPLPPRCPAMQSRAALSCCL